MSSLKSDAGRATLEQVLEPEAELTWEPGPRLTIHGRSVELKLTSARVLAAFKELAQGADVDHAAAGNGVMQDLRSAVPWSGLLRTLDTVGAVRYRLPDEAGEPVAELVAITRGPLAPPPRTRDLSAWTPNPAATVRIEGDRLALQAPDGRCQVYLAPGGAAAWAEVAARRTPTAAWWPEFARMLAAASALIEKPPTPEEMLWSVAEWSAYLHARRPDTVSGYAGTYRGAQTVPVPPARWEPGTTTVLDLPRPDLENLERTDPSLTAVSEARRSRREHDDARPITLDQLSELLYRVARVRHVMRGEGAEVVDRPVPAGGSLHEIEVF